jgi:hypothetical protein
MLRDGRGVPREERYPVTSDVLESLALADRQQAVRRALAEALQLTRLQVGVLVRLEEADEAGDVAAVLRYHAELDDLMTRLTTVDRVRTGVRAELPDETDLSCSACGAVTEPLYETPRLLGYTCGACGWTGDDPAVQAERRDEEAKDFAAKTVQRSVPALRDAMETLNHRGKKERQQGTAALAALHENLEQAVVHVQVHQGDRLPGPEGEPSGDYRDGRVGRDERGHYMRAPVPARPMCVYPAAIGRQQVGEGRQQVLVAARAEF